LLSRHEAWLALTQETPIDPDLPICDPHHHLWNSPDKLYLLRELFQDIGGGHNIIQTVCVESESIEKSAAPESIQPVNETRFIHAATDREIIARYGKAKIAAGIMGHADLRLGSRVKAVLEAHLASSDRFRGIRQVGSWDANKDIIFSPAAPGLLQEPDFRKGLACLKEYGLCYETFVYHPQMMELADLAGAFPDIPIILDHVGGPIRIGPYARESKAVFQEWKQGITALAACPNVFVKLGGLGMPFCGFGWSERPAPPNSIEMAETTAPYYLWCIEQFGVERCMFESNFPVEKESCSYSVLWNSFKRITRDFSADERKALFLGTAARAYRL
jgi:L-fuconolactonase